MGRGAGDDAAVAPGHGSAGSAGDRLARPPAPGQEAGTRRRLQPRAGQKAPALWRADRRHPGQPSRTAGRRRRAGRDRRDDSRALARRGRPLPAADPRILAQSERRVLNGETVPAGDKLVSLFEPHADIICKGGRQVQYGHKLNLATGKSGLILDVVVETGNPADAERFVPMLDRHIARAGAPPRQTAADGGYASCANLAAAKARGVADVAFHKKCGIAITEMVKSPWVYRRLRNFRAGIEAAMSCFKRAYGAARCTWRGLEHKVRRGGAQPGAV